MSVAISPARAPDIPGLVTFIWLFGVLLGGWLPYADAWLVIVMVAVMLRKINTTRRWNRRTRGVNC